MTSTEAPCLPTYRPRSLLRVLTMPILGRLTWTSVLACCDGWPTCRTRVTAEADGTAWSACSPWPPLRSWLAHGSVTAIAEWAADLPQPMLAALGARRDPLTGRRHAAGEATIRRVLARIDADAFDLAVGAWLADRLRPPTRRCRRAIAVDGKTLRGATGEDGAPVRLLAALDHTHGVVLAQRGVDAASNEISAFGPLLEGLDLAGAIVTADALHTQRAHASFLVGRHADDVLVVKANQPALHTQLARLPWREVPVMDRTRDQAHGRVELPRTMATLRNLAISVLRLAGVGNIAAALRHNGRDPTRPLTILGLVCS